MTVRLSLVITALALVALAAPAAAQKKGNDAKPSDNYDQVFQQYLATAKTLSQGPPPAPWMSTLFGDVKARNVNDLVTVQVIDAEVD